MSRFFGRGRPPRRFEALSIAARWDRPARFICPTDVRVLCLSGTAWITTDADIRDVVLEAGQVHCAPKRARMFINGMPFCELRIE
ncbi:MAG TPA: DUF2917 domain-containing protein [Ideonella sp.]|nr:DUF2917 domain-containing protein [Ideonella sp.]